MSGGRLDRRALHLRAVSVAGVLTAGCLAACDPGAESGLEAVEPRVLVEASQTADPSLAVDPVTGELLMAWIEESGGEWDLRFARSSDAGESFSAPVRVNDVPGQLHPHPESAPRLVAARGAVALFWNNRIEVEGRRFAASDLLFARSTDGGESWSAARPVQDPLGIEGLPPRGHSFHGAAAAGDSTLVVAWLDGRERDRRRIERAVAAGLDPAAAATRPDDLADEADPSDGDAATYAAISHDLGESWEPENRRVAGGICPCCRVSLAVTPAGGVVGGWRAHFGADIRDPAVATVIGPGGEGHSMVRVHEDGWEYPGCPHSGPGLDVDSLGRVHAAWYTAAEGRMGIHYARAENGLTGPGAFESPFPVVQGDHLPVAHPSIVALRGGGAVIAHNVDQHGRRVIVVSGVAEDGTLAFQEEIAGSEGGTHPQLARLPDGRVVVAWTVSRDGILTVGLARLQPRRVGP